MAQYLTPQIVSRTQNAALAWQLIDDEAEYADVVTAGFLTAQQNLGNDFQANDSIFVSYVGGAGLFSMSFNGSIITLVPAIVTLNTNLSAEVEISAAEFLGMYAAPKLLVAAPGANKLIIVDRMVLVMTYGAAQFAAGGVVAAQYDSTANGAGVKATNTQQASDFNGAAASASFFFNGASGNSSQAAFSTSVNKGLYLSNQTAAFTTGDSNMVAQINYHIIEVA
jgi:hypothetical protein